VIHKNGGGQAMQLAYDWANQTFINEKKNDLPYEHTFLIESDVIIEANWDQQMINLIPTLPKDWLTLDVQSVDLEGNAVRPMDNTPIMGFARDDLEITQYPDFQVTLFNNKIFESGIQISSFPDHFDTSFGRTTARMFGGRHFRTKTIKAFHYVSQSTKYLTEKPIV